jgi:glutamate formiminotransferase
MHIVKILIHCSLTIIKKKKLSSLREKNMIQIITSIGEHNHISIYRLLSMKIQKKAFSVDGKN